MKEIYSIFQLDQVKMRYRKLEKKKVRKRKQTLFSFMASPRKRPYLLFSVQGRG